MKDSVTWGDVRDILDILQIEDGSRVVSIKIDPDMVRVESRYGLKGFREDSVYITGDVKALEREPVHVECTTLADPEPVYMYSDPMVTKF